MKAEWSPECLYTAFDVFPGSKGSAVHIHHFFSAMREWSPRSWLHVLGEPGHEAMQREGSVTITRFQEAIPNFLIRAELFNLDLYHRLKATGPSLRLAHFRDPWGGLAVLHQEKRAAKTVYEVNGLPSIELPYHYPGINTATLEKIRKLERYCLDQSDAILVPSHSLARNLSGMGVPAHKLSVIQNGAEVPVELQKPVQAPDQYLIYFGAIQSWQGLDILLHALKRLSDLPDLKLVICASVKEKASRGYRKLIARLGLEERVIWLFRLPQRELFDWVNGALLSIAPLKDCSRNRSQGCSPLKILESMACGTAVVASDLPVVRELLDPGETGILVRPDRPAELARAIRIWMDHPGKRAALAARASNKARTQFTWASRKASLKALYTGLFA